MHLILVFIINGLKKKEKNNKVLSQIISLLKCALGFKQKYPVLGLHLFYRAVVTDFLVLVLKFCNVLVFESMGFLFGWVSEGWG